MGIESMRWGGEWGLVKTTEVPNKPSRWPAPAAADHEASRVFGDPAEMRNDEFDEK